MACIENIYAEKSKESTLKPSTKCLVMLYEPLENLQITFCPNNNDNNQIVHKKRRKKTDNFSYTTAAAMPRNNICTGKYFYTHTTKRWTTIHRNWNRPFYPVICQQDIHVSMSLDMHAIYYIIFRQTFRETQTFQNTYKSRYETEKHNIEWIWINDKSVLECLGKFIKWRKTWTFGREACARKFPNVWKPEHRMFFEWVGRVLVWHWWWCSYIGRTEE